jgi:hypothetical protein
MADNNKTINIGKSMVPIRRKGVCVLMLDIHIHFQPQALPRNKLTQISFFETVVNQETARQMLVPKLSIAILSFGYPCEK